MPPRYPVNTLELLLKHCYLSPCCQTRARSAAAPSSTNQKHYAIVGGGITGLSTAYYLVKRVPNAKVTLFESNSHLGGWLQTKFFDVANGKVMFEQGPRTLRGSIPNGLLAHQLARELSLQNEIRAVSQSSKALRSRFIYYPDHLFQVGGAITLPELIQAFLNEPVLTGILPALFRDYFWAPKRSADVGDESMGDFFSRRGNEHIVNNILSAVMHGIYAGDIYKLSMKSIMPWIWDAELRHGGFVREYMDSRRARSRTITASDGQLFELLKTKELQLPMESRSTVPPVWSFKKGISQLSDAIQFAIERSPNVQIVRSTDVLDVQQSTSEQAKIEVLIHDKLRNQKDKKVFTTAISTVASGSALNLGKHIPELNVPAVTVMVVNLYYSSLSVLPVSGFGYLIPRSIPFEQNPECALGVIFDSDIIPGQDTVLGTRVTVMIGGHWWDDWPSYPDEEQGARMAKNVLARHLNITEEPELVNASLQKNCIPQYYVGHPIRMKKADDALRRKFKGAVKVAGNSYRGVGVNDCIRSAYDIVDGIASGKEETTGLEDFQKNIGWAKLLDQSG